MTLIKDKLDGKAVSEIEGLTVEGDLHGIKNGWFSHPINYDPQWLVRCDGFEEKKEIIFVQAREPIVYVEENDELSFIKPLLTKEVIDEILNIKVVEGERTSDRINVDWPNIKAVPPIRHVEPLGIEELAAIANAKDDGSYTNVELLSIEEVEERFEQRNTPGVIPNHLSLLRTPDELFVGKKDAESGEK